jgi:hypothetical protein
MGKGFRATEGVLGQDLSELIMAPCRKRVRVDCYEVNSDSPLTILAEPTSTHGLNRQRLFCDATVTCL